MRTIFRVVYIISVSFLIANCTPPPKADTPDVPDFKMPTDVQMALDMIIVCNKKASEIAVSDEARENTLVVEDKIESQDLEKTDCDGKVEKSHGPVRELNQIIALDAPAELSDIVTFVRIENARTCSAQVFDSNEKLAGYEIKTDDGQEVKLPHVVSEGDSKGNLRVVLSDSKYKFNIFTNVNDGTNVLKVSYFGKCLKLRENPDEKIKSQYYRCQEAELLGTKEILLTVHVERPEVPGTKKINTCSKK